MKSQVKDKSKVIVSKLPSKPGVYFFRDSKGKILYIGKATSLKDRVRSYFSGDIEKTRGPLIVKMLEDFKTVDHYVTDSVLEALVLEAHLIKKHHPEANVALKDDRSFNFVVITKEDFPRVIVMRGRELFLSSLGEKPISTLPFKVAHTFGPFTHPGQLREALKMIRRMFPYRDEKCEALSGIPCWSSQIGLCPGVCTGKISKEDYAKTIENIVLFFEGNKKELVKNLEKQMKSFAKEKKFEEADLAKRTLFALNHIQDISLIKDDIKRGIDPTEIFRVESYDIAHMAGQNVVGVMTVVENGEAKRSDYRRFKIRSEAVLKDSRGVNDTKALAEVLTRRLGHLEWMFPNLIVVDGGTAQKRIMEKILKEHHQNIPVVSVVKDERHKPREILGDKRWLKYESDILLSNAEAHRYGIGYHKKLRRIV